MGLLICSSSAGLLGRRTEVDGCLLPCLLTVPAEAPLVRGLLVVVGVEFAALSFPGAGARTKLYVIFDLGLGFAVLPAVVAATLLVVTGLFDGDDDDGDDLDCEASCLISL